MATWRTTLSLDVVNDHELIARLVELQQQRQASEVLRVALREHFKIQPTLQDVLARLNELEALLLSLQGGRVQAPPLSNVAADDNTAAAAAGLDRALARFK